MMVKYTKCRLVDCPCALVVWRLSSGGSFLPSILVYFVEPCGFGIGYGWLEVASSSRSFGNCGGNAAEIGKSFEQEFEDRARLESDRPKTKNQKQLISDLHLFTKPFKPTQTHSFLYPAEISHCATKSLAYLLHFMTFSAGEDPRRRVKDDSRGGNTLLLLCYHPRTIITCSTIETIYYLIGE